MKLATFNIDVQNGLATFSFNQPLPPGTVGIMPWVNISVKVEEAERKTGAQIKEEAATKATEMLAEVARQMRGFGEGQ